MLIRVFRDRVAAVEPGFDLVGFSVHRQADQGQKAGLLDGVHAVMPGQQSFDLRVGQVGDLGQAVAGADKSGDGEGPSATGAGFGSTTRSIKRVSCGTTLWTKKPKFTSTTASRTWKNSSL